MKNMRTMIRDKTRLERLNVLLRELNKLEKQHVRLKRKSFEFKFIALLPPAGECMEYASRDRGFMGILIIPLQDLGLFNAGCIEKQPGAGADHEYLPVLYEHNRKKLIGGAIIKLVSPLLSPTYPFRAKTPLEIRKEHEKYRWEVRVLLALEAKPARSIFDLIELHGQSAINTLALGYDVVEKITRIYEISIVKDYGRYELRRDYYQDYCQKCEFFDDEICEAKLHCKEKNNASRSL